MTKETPAEGRGIRRRTPLRHPRGPHQPRWELVSWASRQGHLQTQAGHLFNPGVAANEHVEDQPFLLVRQVGVLDKLNPSGFDLA